MTITEQAPPLRNPDVVESLEEDKKGGSSVETRVHDTTGRLLGALANGGWLDVFCDGDKVRLDVGYTEIETLPIAPEELELVVATLKAEQPSKVQPSGDTQVSLVNGGTMILEAAGVPDTSQPISRVYMMPPNSAVVEIA